MSKYLMKQGEYLVIETNGKETRVEEKPTMARILAAIGCTGLDTVCLTKGPDGAETVMCVDDTGLIDHKPYNETATLLYRVLCHPKPIYEQPICGNVVLVHDKDFE